MRSDQKQRRSTRQRLLSAVLLVVSSAGAAHLLWREWDDLTQSAQMGLPLISALLGLQALYLISQSEKLRLILADHSKQRVSGLQWLRVFYVGRLLNSVFVQSGNLFRLMKLRNDFGIGTGQFASALSTQSWLAIVTSLAIAGILSVFAIERFGIGAPTPVILTGLAAAALVAPFLLHRFTRFIVSKRSDGRVANVVDGIVQRITQTLRSPRLVVLLTFNAAWGFLTGSAILILAYRGAGVDLPWFMAATLLAVLQTSNIVVLTPGNLGIQELGFAALTGVIGYSGAVGVVASAAVRISGLLALAICAAMAEIAFRFSAPSEPVG